MEGLRFYRNSVTAANDNGLLSFHHSSLEDQRADFDYIFSPIYKFLKRKLLLNDELPIFNPDFEYETYNQYSNYIVQDHDSFIIARASILESCGRNIPEFEGNLIVIVEDNPFPYQEVWNDHLKFEQKRPESIHCFLSNWDGLYWDIYTKEKSILDTLISQHANDDSLEIYHVDSNLDYPEPRRTKEKLERANGL